MIKYIIHFISILFFFSCKGKGKNEVHYFNYYDENDEVISYDTFKIVIDRQSFLKAIYIKESQIVAYKEQQHLDGIYRAIDTVYQKTHHFYHVIEYFRNTLKVSEPFLYPEIRYNFFKNYILEKDTFKVIAFSEANGTSGTWTYYLSNFGFICYYDKDLDSYSFCDSTQNSTIKAQVLQKLRHLLVSDTSLFARHGYRRMNYNRNRGVE